MHVRRLGCLLVSLAVLAGGAPRDARAATAFTYQGQLQQNGTPVSGPCDLRFGLFDAATDGNPIGLLNILLNTAISNGLFTVPLDFGAVFDGSARWLEIETRCPAGPGEFTLLAPRQLLTPAPYAIGLQYPFAGAADSGADAAFAITNFGAGAAARFVKPGDLNPSGPAIVAQAGGLGSIAIVAESTAPSGGGIRGLSIGTLFPGVEGQATSDNGGTGVEGEASGVDGTGVRGIANEGDTAKAVHGQSSEGFAGFFDGKVRVISASSNEPDAFVVSINGTNQARIDSMGKGFFNGGTQMGGADVAEFVLTTGAPRPGDVVEIDSENPGHFRLSALANSTAVAGVISTQPGVSLNASDGAAAPVDGPQLALVGRVPVKVTAENGPIRPGDLLVTSTVPGRAMRGPLIPAAGTVIGKALTAHAEGEGVVEMLVMLR